VIQVAGGDFRNGRKVPSLLFTPIGEAVRENRANFGWA
jgi:hypothetical protein